MRSLSPVLIAARPMAPPRLRIRLNRPEAFFTRSGARVPSAVLVTGTIAKISPSPRKICGHSSSQKSQSRVSHVICQVPMANSTKPPISMKRGSNLWLNCPAIGAPQEHCDTRDEHGVADHARVVTADLREINRIEIGQAVKADAEHEREQASNGEVAVRESAQIDDRHLCGEDASEERDRRQRRDYRE